MILAFLLFNSACLYPRMTLAESSEDGIYDTYDNIQVWDQASSGNGLWSLMTSSAYHNPGLYVLFVKFCEGRIVTINAGEKAA